MIIATLVGQGRSLPLLVRRLGLTEHPAVAAAERRARLTLTQAVLDRLQAGRDGDGVAPEFIDGCGAVSGPPPAPRVGREPRWCRRPPMPPAPNARCGAL